MPTSAMTPSASNRFGWDYAQKARELGPPVVPIIDAHTHIHGVQASRLYAKVRTLFGVERTYSMTQLPMAQAVRDELGDTIRFITIPTWSHQDKTRSHRDLYLRDIEIFHRDLGARMMKLWASPRLREFVPGGATDLSDIDSSMRREHARLAVSLGMCILVHVADPDTWFSTRYRDGSVYGTKAHQYVGLERMLDEFAVPWMAAHMGGWPEDLAFLDGLLTRHPNLHLDTSATKWIARELSKHPREEFLAFMWKWNGRILFGTDLVTLDDQLSTTKSAGSAMGDLASSPEEAFDLYCSRHWVLRTLFESAYDDQSPIADPDLKMVDPSRHDAMSAPRLSGKALPAELLKVLYRGGAEKLLDAWWATH